MAGLGIKVFQDGVKLTAAEINGYLMDQTVCVFTDESDRDASFGGAGEPVLSPGRVCYLENRTIIQYYNGSQWVDSAQFSVSQNNQVSPGVLQLDRLVSATPGQVIVCNSSGVPTYVTLSGDIEISNTGQVTITANPTFAGATIDAVRVGVTTANEIDTTSGNLVLDSTGGTVTVDDNLSVSGSVSVTGNIVGHAVPEAAASLTNTIDGKIVEVSGSSMTLTTTGGSWLDGTQFTVIATSGALTITAGTGTTFRAAPLNGSNVKLRTQYSSATFIYKASGSYWYVIGDLTSS